jgi:hypothetical protein
VAPIHFSFENSWHDYFHKEVIIPTKQCAYLTGVEADYDKDWQGKNAMKNLRYRWIWGTAIL